MTGFSSEMDGLWYQFYVKRVAEIRSGGESAWGNRGSEGAAIANLRDLVRQQSPAAWGEILNDERIAPHRR